jgi:hypothetical protein
MKPTVLVFAAIVGVGGVARGDDGGIATDGSRAGYFGLDWG